MRTALSFKKLSRKILLHIDIEKISKTEMIKIPIKFTLTLKEKKERKKERGRTLCPRLMSSGVLTAVRTQGSPNL